MSAKNLPGEIQTIMLDDDAVAYATFQSHNQKVISNDRGIFTTHIRTANTTKPVYTAQQWRLSQSIDGGKTFNTVYERTGATSAPVLEIDSNNNIYLMRPDFLNDNAYIDRFLDGADFSTPLTAEIPSGGSDKYVMAIDEARQLAYIYSRSRTFSIANLNGEFIRGYSLTERGPNARVMYPHLALADNGDLYAAWTTERFDSYIYLDIHAIKSTDAGESWTKLDGVTPLTTPIIADNTGPADTINNDDEYAVHSWLCSMMPKDGKLHFAYSVNSTPHKMRYKRYDQAAGNLEIDCDPFFTSNPDTGKNNSGFFCSRRSEPGATLYYVTGNLHSLFCFASDDNGATWYDYAVGDEVYPINKAGWHGLYAIGGSRELTADGHIIGTYTEVADFAKSYYEPHSGKAHFFKI